MEGDEPLAAATGDAQGAPKGERPWVGLALSGGGARGLAHIGVLKALERAGVPVDCLAGASMGGVIAAGYAAGMSAAELERQALELSRLRNMLRLADPGLPDAGLLRGRRLQAFFEERFGQRTFADLHRPLALIAVDLNSRRELALRQGPVALALRATTAVPGLIAPVEVDGMRLVDGGLLNNLPVDAVKDLGAQVILAVDVEPAPGEETGARFRGAPLPEGLLRTLTILDEATSLMIAELQHNKLATWPPDVLIRPRLPAGVNLLMGYQRAAELIQAGERAAQEALPQILDACTRKGVRVPT